MHRHLDPLVGNQLAETIHVVCATVMLLEQRPSFAKEKKDRCALWAESRFETNVT